MLEMALISVSKISNCSAAMEGFCFFDIFQIPNQFDIEPVRNNESFEIPTEPY